MKADTKARYVLRKLLGKAPTDVFDTKMNNVLQEYSENASTEIITETIKCLKDTKREIVKRDYDKIEKIIDSGYSIGIDKVRKTLLNQRTKLYKYYKGNISKAKSIYIKQLIVPEDKKDLIKKAKYLIGKNLIEKAPEAEIDYSLDKIDERAIESLTNGDMVYIKNEHPQKSTVAKDIKAEMIAGTKEGLLGNQVALLLVEKFSEYTPKQYAERFGETNYWNGVVRNYNSITKSTVSILDLQRAKQKTYKWYARMTERTCKICASLHNKTFLVQSAVDNLNMYLDASDAGDVTAMQEANKWVNETEAGEMIESDGFFPPAHFRCECFVRMDLGYDYK